MLSYKKIKRIVCVLIALVLFCLTILPAYATTTLEVKHSTDIAVSDDAWWNRGVQYGRILVLNNQNDKQDNVLLATHCKLNSGLTENAPGYPIYRCDDNGKTWKTVPIVICLKKKKNQVQ